MASRTLIGNKIGPPKKAPEKPDIVFTQKFILYNLISVFLLGAIIYSPYLLPKIRQQLFSLKGEEGKLSSESQPETPAPPELYPTARSQFSRWLQRQEEYKYQKESADRLAYPGSEEALSKRSQFQRLLSKTVAENCYMDCMAQNKDNSRDCQLRCTN